MRRWVVLVVAAAGFLQAGQASAWSWPASGSVLEEFSFGSDPYAAGQHRGIDVAGDGGAPVLAPASGAVVFAGTVPGGGKTISILTVDGEYSVTLLHLGSIGVVRGEQVVEGAVVGTIGPTGTVEHDQPYVYLGVRVASNPQGYVDPQTLLPPRAEPAVPQPADASAPGETATVQPATGPPAAEAADTAEPASVAQAASIVPAASATPAADSPEQAAVEPTQTSTPATDPQAPPRAIEPASLALGSSAVPAVVSRPAATAPPLPAELQAVRSPAAPHIKDDVSGGGRAVRAVRAVRPAAAATPSALDSRVISAAPTLRVGAPTAIGPEVVQALGPGSIGGAVVGRAARVPEPIAIPPVVHVAHAVPAVALRPARPVPIVAPRARTSGPSVSFLFVILTATLLAVAVAVAIVMRRRLQGPEEAQRVPRMMGPDAGEAALEADSGRPRVAVCERATAHWSRRRLCRPGGRRRAIPPAPRQPRPHGERDGRAWHARDGRRRRRGGVAA
jgi:peptidase M23-like protein